MKINHIWTVLCRESILNQDDNTISLIGVVEEVQGTLITQPDKPLRESDKKTIPLNLELVNTWTKDDQKEIAIQVKVVLLDPNSTQMMSVINDSIFPSISKRLRTRLKIQGFPATVSGRYFFIISLKTKIDKDFREVSEIPVDVMIKIEQQKEAPLKS